MELSIKSISHKVLDLIFPEKCIGCHTPGTILCELCKSKIKLAERETETDIIALYDYREKVVKDLVWELKYHKKRYIGKILGKLLYEGIIEEVSDLKQYQGIQKILIIPVPIIKNRMKLRGYNQAETIARAFASSGNVNMFEIDKNIIYKNKVTTPQARIANRNDRISNIKGAFSIKNVAKVKGRTVIVIDDVTTTGATMVEIMKLLRKNGADKVIGFAVAH